MKLRTWLTVVALLAATPADAAQVTRRYVMVVAHNRSNDPGVKPLRYADDDGVRYYEFFRMTAHKVALLSVLDDETARLFPAAAQAARPPTRSALFETLKRWNREMAADHRAGRSSDLVFIYAGHGDMDKQGEGYVNLLGGKLRRRDLYQQVLAPSKANFVHLVIDACKSYFLVNRRGGSGDWKDDSAPESHDAEIRAFLNREDLSSYPKVGVILATSGDESTHEWNRFRAGILSHGLRSALTGSADINGDGKVEYSETHAFLAASTARVRHPEARLRVWARPPAANRHQPLIDLRNARGARLLRFGPQLAGKFYLEDDRGIRYADMNKAPGTRFDVAVQRQRTYFLHNASSEARIGPGQQRVAVAQLQFKQTELAMRGSVETSFRKDLFSLAYSRGFYDGFCARTGLAPVEGGATEFVIRRPAPAASYSGGRNHLRLGYMATGALLDLSGASHGVELAYDVRLHRNLALGLTVQYGRSSHQAPDGDSFSLHRIAALASVAGVLPVVVRRLDARAELLVGYQGFVGQGSIWLDGANMGQSSDTLGLRMEAGLGLRLDLLAHIYADLRGGVGIGLVTLERGGESEERADITPYGALSLGTTF